MCSSCSSNNNQLQCPRPLAFQPVPEQTTSSTITLAPYTSSPSFQILQCSLLSIPSNRVTRALWDIYLTLDIHKQKTSLVIYALQDLIISREEIGRQLVFTKFADIQHIFI